MLRHSPRWLRALLCAGALGCSGLAASTAAAQTPAPAPTRAMTLREALAYAAAHQPQIAAARARIAAARADAAVPRAQWFPTVGAAAELVFSTTNNSTATTISPGVVDIARIGGTPVVDRGSLKPAPSTLVGVGVGQEIFDFGRIAAQTAALEAAVEVEKQRAVGADLDVSYAVAAAYFAVQGARSVLAAAEGAHARAAAHRDLARAGVESGMRPPIELARAEADVMRFDVGRIRARGGLAAAQAQLAAAVGVPDAVLDAADDPTASAPAAPSLEAAIRDASARDPVILEAIAKLKAQEERTRAIRAEMRPNLWLTGAFTGRGGGADPSNGDPAIGSGWAPTIPNWHVGVVLSWRVFDMTTIARADASRAREQVHRAELDGVRQQQVAAVQRAVLAEQVARDALPALERARDAARASYAQVEARFKAGLATSVELADAEALRTEAEIQEAVGRFEAARARSALGRAIGENPWSKRSR